MNQLVYPREQVLGLVTLGLGLLVWLSLIVGTFGGALGLLAIGFVFYLFAQSALIAYIKGNGVELSSTQFPDLYAQFVDCCDRLKMTERPQAYVLNGNGGLNAFATKFLGTQYVVLMSDVIDAMDTHADGVRFYIGHELGHLRRKHLNAQFLRWPVLWLPLIGAAYSRARETTCDRHGRACCDSPDGATRALVALAAGAERWKGLDMPAYVAQAKHSSGFWMSFHELIAGYPWLTKRAARLTDAGSAVPKRNGFAYLFALFVPYAGRLGGGFALVIVIYVIGVLAAVAIPAYQDYIVKAKLGLVVANSEATRKSLTNYYESHQSVPASLETAGLPAQLSDGTALSLDPKSMVLALNTKYGELIFTPVSSANGHIVWRCSAGEKLRASQLPASCSANQK